MNIIVQKFGGTSVSTEENRRKCIEHIKTALKEYDRVVVVVSAMGRKGDPYATDTLLSLLNGDMLPKKEKDLLLSTGEIISANVFSNMLFNEQINNAVLTGGQAGIITNDDYTNAKIISLQPSLLLETLKKHQVVVVPGFQGMTPKGDITTLGRGGSDTSATALGVALNAIMVDIFTDVEGIMTADPRLVSEAKILDKVSYNEICNLAYLGAKVIHPRAVEIAMQKNIPIRVRSTFSEKLGTLVTNVAEFNNNDDYVSDRIITGITQTPNLAQIKVTSVSDFRHTQAKVFKTMEESNISVDFINVHPNGVVFTVFDDEYEKAKTLLETLGYDVEAKCGCAKVSLVGAGIAGVPGVMSKIVEALSDENIEILQSADSHTTIWVLVDGKELSKSVISLHKKFDLDKKTVL